MEKSVLFVCAGNLCRSPMAEGIFIHKCRQRGVDSYFTVDSAGTEVWRMGARPDPRALKAAKRRGVLLPGWSRLFILKDLTKFDLILAMDTSNLKDLQQMSSPKYLNNIRLMREYDRPGNTSLSVPDPFRGNQAVFEKVFDILNVCCENLLETLSSQLR
ncbi:low molecular weight protein-tyrosine-phosphatase [Fibrobacterota bacterium]